MPDTAASAPKPAASAAVPPGLPVVQLTASNPAPLVTAEPDPSAFPAPAPAPAEAFPPVDVEGLISRMTLEQKIGQLMMVGFGGLTVDTTVEQLVRGRQVGGVCMFKRNIESAEQIARLNDAVRGLLADSIPPFLAVDQEGGNVVRIQEGAVVLPGNMALGATRSEKLAYEAGRAQAEDLKLLGFNMNLAPVLDVNVNPKNPVIGIRAFGDDPKLVSAFGAAFVKGQQDANIATVAKHFPGHGNTDSDSHRSLPVMAESAQEMEAQMAPFSAAIAEGLDGLMTAHVAIPALTGDNQPATLSPKVLTSLLRKKMGFDGVVLTDELEMEAIAQRFGVGRAAVMSIAAGADMVLIPWRAEKKTEVYESLLHAVRNGELSIDRVDEAVRRILTLKARRGMFQAPPPVEDRIAQLQRARSDVDRRIAQGAVTLLRSDGRAFPIAPGKRVAVLTAEAALGRAVLARAGGGRMLVVPAYASHARRADARAKARELALSSDVVVVGMINSRQVELVTMAAAAGKPVIAVAMGLPYLAELVPEASAVIAVYSYRESAADAAVAAIFGDAGTPGKLPVSLRHFPFGYGIESKPANVRVERHAAR